MTPVQKLTTTNSLLKFARQFFLVCSCCMSLVFPALSQTMKISSAASMAEKIYLQIDNTAYTTDQTIWFKAIVIRSVDHTPTKLSGVLYVDLIGPSENILEKKLIRLEEGIGDGFFQLTKNYTPGIYLVRAYTEWNKNFGPDFFFRQYIQLFSAETSYQPNPIPQVTVTKGQKNDSRLNVRFAPLAIDSGAGKELLLFITVDDRKDTVSVKRNSSNEYLLNYPLQDRSQFVTLGIQTSNQINYTRTIVLDENYLDLRFFPESGEMVHGLSSLLGIKALDHQGRGRALQGEIVNGKGAVVSAFQTNQLGMGRVMLENVQQNETYTARIISPAGTASQTRYALPQVAAKGNYLSVRKEGNNIRLNASSTYMADESVLVRAACRGSVYFDIKGRLKNGHMTYALPQDVLPEGVIAFTFMKDSAHPVAERLYFNQRPESRIKITVSSDKESYLQREQTRLSIEAKNREGEAIPADVSVLVFNRTQQEQVLNTRQNILSYFLLIAELKGEVENPGFYFAEGKDRREDIDALLLTQGWRKYNYAIDTIPFRFDPEFDLTVSGNVKGGLLNNKEKKEAELIMMTFGAHPSLQTQKTDSLGRFNFLLNDVYGQSLNILIQSANKSGKQKNYTITLNRKESPPVLFNHMMSVERPDSFMQAYIQKSIERKKSEGAFKASSGSATLEEVVVKTQAMTPERKLVTDTYGKPKVIISGKEIRDKEAKWSYGLYSVLLFNFPDKIDIIRGGNGTLYARLYNREPTLVVVDGIAVKHYDYGLISSIPPSEVKSFEIIEYASNFRQLYCDAIPEGCGPYAPVTGNVIAIYTNGGKGIFSINVPVGIMKTDVPVFATPREFYAPLYEQLKPEEWLKPDLRSLIHWQPRVKVDSRGTTTVSFYNADNPGTMQVIVEAIAANGDVGYQELLFDVKKRSLP